MIRPGARRFMAAVSALLFFFALSRAEAAAGLNADDTTGCSQVLDLVAAAVKSAGTGNASAAPVPGAPFLRTDRFLAALAARIRTPEQTAAWLGRMRDLDRGARASEISTLPEADLGRLARRISSAPEPASIIARYEQCADRLLAEALSDASLLDRIRKSAAVDGEYVMAYRVLGLYPLAAMPVAALTRRAYREFLSWHETPPETLPVTGRLSVFAPRGGRPDRPGYSLDAMGAPDPTPSQSSAILRFFAPVFVVDRAEAFDRPGAVSLSAGEPVIEEGPPSIYTYFSHAFYRNRPVLQVNYVIWFPARGGRQAPAIEHGRLDGITVRITLDRKGVPIAADVMNNCGCYHFFLPAAGRAAALREDPTGIEPLVAGTLPESFPEFPLTLRVNSGWHQVDAVWAAPPDADAVGYRLVPYRRLEALLTAEGKRQSLFTPAGIARGSGRIEPLLLFSMGIPDVGAMRQRGHHAIKLVGRSHFDDPYLFDRTFEWR